MRHLKDLTVNEQLDRFFQDTFLPTTHRKKVMSFDIVNDLYTQWCQQMKIAPIAGNNLLGRALARRYQKVFCDGKKFWFLEIIPDILEEIQGVEDGFSRSEEIVN